MTSQPDYAIPLAVTLIPVALFLATCLVLGIRDQMQEYKDNIAPHRLDDAVLLMAVFSVIVVSLAAWRLFTL